MTTGAVECPRCGRVAVLEPDVQPFCRRCDSPLIWQSPTAVQVTATSGGVGVAAATADPDVMADPYAMAATAEALATGGACGQCGHTSAAGCDFCEICGTALRTGPVRQRQRWVEPVAVEDEATRKRRIALQVAAAVIAALAIAFLVFLIWFLFIRSDPWATSTLDVGNASWDISLALLDDRPVISYVDSGNQAVRVLACANTECAARQSTEVAATLGGTGQGNGTGIAISEAGLPVISFRSGETAALTVVACFEVACTDEPVPVQLDPLPSTAEDDGGEIELRDAGYNSSVVIGNDGLPLITYWDRALRALMAAHCTTIACTSATTSVLARAPLESDDTTTGGGDTAAAVGPNGPVIAFRNESPTRLDLLQCSDNACTSGKVVTLVPRVDQPDSTSLQPGFENSIAIDAGGLPVVVYRDRSDAGIHVVRCLDEACNAVERNAIDASDDWHAEPSIALLGRNPVIAYRETPDGDESGHRLLKVVRCQDPSCSRKSEAEVVDGAPPTAMERVWRVISRQTPLLGGRIGYSPAIGVTGDGRIVIAYGDATEGALKLAVSN